MCTPPGAAPGSMVRQVAGNIIRNAGQSSAAAQMAPNDPRRRLITAIAASGKPGLGAATSSNLGT